MACNVRSQRVGVMRRARETDRYAGRDVALLIGQSNAGSHGAPRSDWPQCEGFDAGVQFSSDLCAYGEWTLLSELTAENAAGWVLVGGFSAALGTAMRNAGLSPAIAVQAWDGNSAAQIQALVPAAVAFWLTRMSELSEIRSVQLVWSQGEAEAATGDDWISTTQASVAAVRSGLGMPDLRLSVIQLPTAYVPSNMMSAMPHLAEIRAEQAAIVTADGNAFLADPGVATTVDGIHHDYATATRVARLIVAQMVG